MILIPFFSNSGACYVQAFRPSVRLNHLIYAVGRNGYKLSWCSKIRGIVAREI